MEFLRKLSGKLPLKKKLMQDASVIAINAATDTATHFSLGSVIMAWPVSKTAACINAGRAALCCATRLATEFENAGYNLPLPQKFKKFAKNKGASLFTAGAITYMSTAFALANATPVDPKTYIPAAALALFGTSHIGLATATSLKEDNKYRPIINAAAMTTMNFGLYCSAGPDKPWWLILPYIASAGSAIVLSLKGQNAKGLLQPDYYAGAACLSNSFNAFTSGNPYYGATNLIYSLGFYSLDKLKKKGGLAQSVGLKPANDDVIEMQALEVK